MTLDYLITWMLVFLRAIGLVLQLPVVAGRPLPIPVRVGLCIMLGNLTAGLVPPATISLAPWSLMTAAASEVIVGLALGFVVRFTFAAVEMAGRIMTSEVGLTATPGMGVPEPASEPLAAVVSSFAVVLFFLLGAHHEVISAFVLSFQHAGAGRALLQAGAGMDLIDGTAGVITLGLRIAAPFIAMNFLVTLAFASLARVVPKTNVFVVSMSARALLGVGLLGVAGSLIARYLYVEFAEIPIRMLHLLPAR
jgi:flagellar biosynthetic protein FliR